MKRFLISVLVAMLLLGSCRQAGQEVGPELQNPVGIDVDTVQVVRQDISDEVIYAGEIIPTIVDLSFEGSGDIGKMNVDVGDKVKKGDLLATLAGVSDAEVIKEKKAAIQSAKENYEASNKMSEADISALKVKGKELKKLYQKEKDKTAKKQYNIQWIMQEYDIKIAKKKLSQMKEDQALELSKLQKEYEKAKGNKGFTRLTAPFNGEVVSISGGAGHMVQGGSAVVQLAKMNVPRVKTEFILDKILANSSYVAVVNGKEYEIETEIVDIPAWSGGEDVAPVYTYFDFVSKNVKCKVGDFAMIHLRKSISKDALSVPVNAVLKDEDSSYLYVDENGSKVRRTVTVGVKTPAYAEILTGVKEGELVYVES